MHPSRVLPLLMLASFSACRSAGPSARPSAPQAPTWLEAYVGQSRIVLGLAEARGLALARRDLGKPLAACDVAVEVRQARLEKDTLRLRLGILGRARLQRGGPTRAPQAKCAALEREAELSIAGFSAADGDTELQAALDQVLPTPEAYLQVRGITSGALPTDDPKAALANNDPTAPPEQQALWRRLAGQARPILSVDAEIHDPARKTHYEGEIQFRSVVGVHGRLRDVQIATSLASEQETHIRRVLALWRFEPARGPQGPVAMAYEARVILKID